MESKVEKFEHSSLVRRRPNGGEFEINLCILTIALRLHRLSGVRTQSSTRAAICLNYKTSIYEKARDRVSQ